jgi:hypothetical protein
MAVTNEAFPRAARKFFCQGALEPRRGRTGPPRSAHSRDPGQDADLTTARRSARKPCVPRLSNPTAQRQEVRAAPAAVPAVDRRYLIGTLHDALVRLLLRHGGRRCVQRPGRACNLPEAPTDRNARGPTEPARSARRKTGSARRSAESRSGPRQRHTDSRIPVRDGSSCAAAARAASDGAPALHPRSTRMRCVSLHSARLFSAATAIIASPRPRSAAGSSAFA